MPALRACTRHALHTLRQGLRHEVLDGDSGLNAIDSNRVAEPLRDARPQLDEGCVHAFPSQRSWGDGRAHRAPFRGALVRAVRGRTRGDCPCATPAVAWTPATSGQGSWAV